MNIPDEAVVCIYFARGGSIWNRNFDSKGNKVEDEGFFARKDRFDKNGRLFSDTFLAPTFEEALAWMKK